MQGSTSGPSAQAGGDRRTAARAQAAGGHRRHHGATAGAPARVVRSQRGADRHRRMALSRVVHRPGRGCGRRHGAHAVTASRASEGARRQAPLRGPGRRGHAVRPRIPARARRRSRLAQVCPSSRQRVPADPTAVARRTGDDRRPDGPGGALRVRCDAPHSRWSQAGFPRWRTGARACSCGCAPARSTRG